MPVCQTIVNAIEAPAVRLFPDCSLIPQYTNRRTKVSNGAVEKCSDSLGLSRARQAGMDGVWRQSRARWFRNEE